jgi:hypothetical protein
MVPITNFAPTAFSEGSIDTIPSPVHAPFPEVVVDGWPPREVVGEQAPLLAAALKEVEDGVQDLAEAVGSGPSMSLGDDK